MLFEKELLTFVKKARYTEVMKRIKSREPTTEKLAEAGSKISVDD